MEQFFQALWGLAAAAVVAVAGVIIPVIRAHLTNLLQQRIGEGAARVAGEIVAKVTAAPEMTVATGEMVKAGVDALQKRFPDTAGKVSSATLAGMIVGEIGKQGMGFATSTPAMEAPLASRI